MQRRTLSVRVIRLNAIVTALLDTDRRLIAFSFFIDALFHYSIPYILTKYTHDSTAAADARSCTDRNDPLTNLREKINKNRINNSSPDVLNDF